jgi:dGTPase
MTQWELLLNEARRKPATEDERADLRMEGRMEMERDYDKIVYSTPIRRLADKTQVFPLEVHDAVRTRLTHSYEVSTLSRSMGLDLATRFGTVLGLTASDTSLEESIKRVRNVAAAMATVGLAHDMGNPPFGHQGEKAIARWFKKNELAVFGGNCGVDEAMRQDFLQFEGNAQTFRLVTRLQIRQGEYGLNLTYGTLAILLKYTSSAAQAKQNSPFAGLRKPGFFRSEESIVRDVWEKTGLREGQRHPLAYAVEACDDIAYSVMDAEDAVKKDLASYADVVAHLRNGIESYLTAPQARLVQTVVEYADKKRNALAQDAISPGEMDDLSMQYLRAGAISQMVKAVLKTIQDQSTPLANGTFQGDLLESSDASLLRKLLKGFLGQVAFSHRSVLEIELRGAIVIEQLMDRLWAAITDRTDPTSPLSHRASPLSRYTYGRISENYRRIFEQSGSDLPIRYREAQLLTDMISGMTDSFALALHAKLREFDS